MEKKTEEMIAGIELALGEIVKPENLNHWISVRSRPIGNILRDCGVIDRLALAFMDVLREVGYAETTGVRGGMSYKIKTDVIPDVHVLAEKIVFRYYEHRNAIASKARERNAETKRYYRPKKPEMSGQPITLPSTVFNLGEMVYMLYYERITQARIVGVRYVDRDTSEKVYYTVEFFMRDRDSEGRIKERYCTVDLPHAKLFKKITDLTYNLTLKINTYKKRSK